jgi:hypothetical protein
LIHDCASRACRNFPWASCSRNSSATAPRTVWLPRSRPVPFAHPLHTFGHHLGSGAKKHGSLDFWLTPEQRTDFFNDAWRQGILHVLAPADPPYLFLRRFANARAYTFTMTAQISSNVSSLQV